MLRALTSSALALPGLAHSAAADGPNLDITADYAYSRYSEDKLDTRKVSPGGQRRRYDVEIHQLRLASPIGDRIDVSLDVSHEAMSGASPWYVLPGPTGAPLQVMSGATIHDERIDGLLEGTYYLDNGSASISGGTSYEKDYLAFNGGIEGQRHFNEKNTTLFGGGSFSLDTIKPTDSDEFPERVKKANKETWSVFGGISHVVNRQITMMSSLQFQQGRGFLSDPYKRAYVDGDTVADSRPERRNQLAWLTRYRHHFSKVDGSLHADYRFYIDDWGINSHTLDLAWHQSLFDAIQLVPSLRYYSQSQAKFYAPWYDGLKFDGLYSSDYRLSPYGALSWRVKAETHFATWRLRWKATISWERYMSRGKWALGNVKVENPGLVSFNLFSVGLTARF